MTHYEIVRKLVGPILPVGDYRDQRLHENLETMIELVEGLVGDICDVAELLTDDTLRARAITFLRGLHKGTEEWLGID